MKITMTSTRFGSPDGHVVNMYNKAETYDIADTLACDFISRGWAREPHASDIIMDNLKPVDMTGWEKKK